jgi:hypothetical protein
MGLRQQNADFFCEVIPYADAACSDRTDPSTGDVLPVLGIQSSPPNAANGVWTRVDETVTTSAVTHGARVGCVTGVSFYDMVYVNASSPSF